MHKKYEAHILIMIDITLLSNFFKCSITVVTWTQVACAIYTCIHPMLKGCTCAHVTAIKGNTSWQVKYCIEKRQRYTKDIYSVRAPYKKRNIQVQKYAQDTTQHVIQMTKLHKKNMAKWQKLHKFDNCKGRMARCSIGRKSWHVCMLHFIILIRQIK